MTDEIRQIEQAISGDPAGRGLIDAASCLKVYYEGEISKAAYNLTKSAKRVGIVTGFYVPYANPPAAETDGPPGAVLLGKALSEIGVEVEFITDSLCENAVRPAMKFLGFAERSLRIVHETKRCFSDDQWLSFLQDLKLSHLISVERVGPAYFGSEFGQWVPPADQNCCHNMRGDILDDDTLPLYKMFELATSVNPKIETVGIGDGGNEIGMGKIPFKKMISRLSVTNKESIACRIATDWNIVAGTSNWGAMALAAAVLHLKKRTELIQEWDHQHHRSLLEKMVRDGLAVDGSTGRPEISVDGLPFETYFQPWQRIREILGSND